MRKSSFIGNLIGNGFSFAVNLVVGVWFTAYLARKLGPAAYGLIPLATTVASYMSVLTSSLTSSVGRAITVAHGANDATEVDRVFNTSFFASLLFSVVLLVPAALVSYFAPYWISVPDGLENQARVIFIAAGLVFLMTTASMPYGVALFCKNRLDLSAGITTGMTLLRVGAVWGLFQVTAPNLWQVGVGLVLAGVSGCVASIIMSRRLMPEFQVRLSSFSRDRLRTLGATGIWVSVTQFGTILMLSVDLLMVNVLLGATDAGRYAIPLQLSMLVRQMFSTLGGLFTPTIMAMHGRGEREALMEYVARGIRMTGYLAAIAGGLLCGFAGPLLTVWLGADFAYLKPLVWVMIAPLAVNLSVFPMFGLALTVNKVRGPGVVTLALGLVHIGVAWLLVEEAGWGMYGVAASAILLLSVKNVFYIPWYTAQAVGTSTLSMLAPVLRVGVVTAAVWAVAAGVNHLWLVDGWVSFFAAGSVAGLLSAILIYFIFLPRADRLVVRSAVLRFKGKYMRGSGVS